jgi:hypothetical protein
MVARHGAQLPDPSVLDLHLLHVVEPLQADQQEIGPLTASEGFFGTVTVIVCRPERMRWLRR